MAHVVIVGAGQAGAAAAAKLRALGFDGDITLIGAESAPPYQRPPLSKAYLLGEMEEERLWLRSPDFWDEANVTLKLSQQGYGRYNRVMIERGHFPSLLVVFSENAPRDRAWAITLTTSSSERPAELPTRTLSSKAIPFAYRSSKPPSASRSCRVIAAQK